MTQTTLEEYLRLSALATAAGKHSEAEKYAREILAALEAHQPQEHHQTYTLRALLIIADALRLQGNIQQAQSMAENAYQLAEQIADKNYSANALRILGLIAMNIGEVATAEEQFRRAFTLSEDSGDIFGQAAALGNIGLLSQRAGEFEKALEWYSRALELSRQINNQRQQALNLNNLGTTHENMSNYQRAMSYYGQAYSLAEEEEDIPLMGTILGNMATCSRNTSDYQRALEYNQRALTLAESSENLENIGIIFSGLANVYDDIGDFPRALEYHQKSLAIDRQIQNKQSIASDLMNIGNVYHALGDFAAALEHYHQSLMMVEELGNKAGIVRRLANIGNISYDYGSNEQALEYFFKALQLGEELNMKSTVAIITSNIGSMYANSTIDIFDDSKAEEFLLRALFYQTELGVKKDIYVSYKALADLYEVRKDWEKSHEYFKKFYQLEKEVQSKEAKDQAERYAVERRTAEYEKESAVQKEREKILDNILPRGITERLLNGEQPIADYAESVSVFFSDIVNFTMVTQSIPAKELVAGLNDLFKQFDMLALLHGIEKIKTIGDAYMAVCGLPTVREDHAERMAQFAIDIQDLCARGVTIAGFTVGVRIGLHCGEVVAGVIGDQKFAYDMWGDAVNTASRMESYGEPGKIHCSAEFISALSLSSPSSPMSLRFQERGEMAIKGKGMMKTYFLEKANP